MRYELLIIILLFTICLGNLVYWIGLVIFDVFLSKFFHATQAIIVHKDINLVMDRPDIPEKSGYSYHLHIIYRYKFNNQLYESSSLNPFNQIKSKRKEDIEKLIGANKDITIFVNGKKPNICYAFSNTYKYSYVFIPIFIHLLGTLFSSFLLIINF